MAQPRENLSVIFHELCSNVYFQPPTNTKLQYPCIEYSFDGVDERHANNNGYLDCFKYTITYITRDPDDPIIRELFRLRFCSFDRSFVKDNLYHYVYSIYY